MYKVARDIANHSREKTISNVMFILEREAVVTAFEIDGSDELGKEDTEMAKYRVHIFGSDGKHRLTLNLRDYDFAMERINVWKKRDCFSFAALFEVGEDGVAFEIGCFTK